MSGTYLAADRRASVRRSVVASAAWGIFLIVLTALFIYPVLMIVIGAFRDGLPTEDVPWTTQRLVEAFTASETWTTLKNSLVLVVASGLITVIGGALFAWISAGTNVPGRKLITPLMVISLFIPPLFHTLGWLMLGNSQNGLINQLVDAVFGVGSWMNIQSWGGLIFLTAIGYMPFAYLLMYGAFRNRDHALDEASKISGAGTLRTFFSITIPSIGPAITGAATLVMVLILQSFDSPQIIGRQAGIYVFSTRIYEYVQNQIPAKYTAAFALSIILILLVLALFLVQKWVLRGRSFTTLTGKTSIREDQNLGPIRWVFSLLVVAFMFVNLVLPLFAMVLGSLQPIFGVMSTGLTLDNYVTVLTDLRMRESLSLTAWLSIIGGLVAMAVALLTSYVVLRRRGALKSYTSFAVWIPWALPGIVLSLAYLFAALSNPVTSGLYSTTTLMAIALIVATIPLASKVAEGALAQLAPELEEAGRTSGAGPIRVLVSIVLRLVIPSFLAGWFLTALFISGNLAIPMLLAAPGSQPVATTALELFLRGDMAGGAALFMIILLAAVILLGIAALAWKLSTKILQKSGKAPLSASSLSHIAT